MIDLHYIKQDIAQNFPISNFEECSYDSNNNIKLVDNNQIVLYNFDEISDTLYKKFGSNCMSPKSFDSLYLELKDRLCFLEFKNTKWGDIKNDDIKLKIYDSLALLSSHYNTSFDIFINTTIFIVHRHNPSIPSPSRKRLNGTCPSYLRLIEEMFKIRIIRYDAGDLADYLIKFNKLPI